MLTPRLTNCPECASIPALLAEIDCKIASMAKILYNNTVFSLNKSVSWVTLYDLLNYKRILTYKVCNPYYGGRAFTVQMIASRIKLLKYK